MRNLIAQSTGDSLTLLSDLDLYASRYGFSNAANHFLHPIVDLAMAMASKKLSVSWASTIIQNGDGDGDGDGRNILFCERTTKPFVQMLQEFIEKRACG